MSCSLFQPEEKEIILRNHKNIDGQDYLAYYSSLGDIFIKSNSRMVMKLKGSHHRYLTRLYKKLKKNNELLLKKDNKPTFYIILSNQPIYFSLPGGKYFFSSGLIQKYLGNEDLLFAVIAMETIRRENDLYPKKYRIPIGYVSAEDVLSAIRLPLNLKVEINKWSYNAIKRAGVDASVYLNWLQIQNKNILDFSLTVGDVNSMAKEEFLFKDFLIGIDVTNTEDDIERRSGESFYQLQNKIRSLYAIRKI